MIITYYSKTTGKCLATNHEKKIFEIASYYSRTILIGENQYLRTPLINVTSDKEIEKLRLEMLDNGYTEKK